MTLCVMLAYQYTNERDIYTTNLTPKDRDEDNGISNMHFLLKLSLASTYYIHITLSCVVYFKISSVIVSIPSKLLTNDTN